MWRGNGCGIDGGKTRGAGCAIFSRSTPHSPRVMNFSLILFRRFSAGLWMAAAASVLAVAVFPGALLARSPEGAATVPLFEGMGAHQRKVTTGSAEAQRYFDQAFTWTYAFNHDEAIRSYEQTAVLDPSCAMAYWGKALCHGPHINNPVMDEPGSRAAWDALQKAKSLAEKATPVERALIGALAARYADPAAGKLPLTAEERRPLDEGYAAAMKKVYAEFPEDADVASLYAEALMDLHPWDMQDPATREARPWTAEIVAVIEQALRINPKHPGANHLYIHAVEGSRTPERANGAADLLRTLVPVSGHLVHMPSHIDVRTGRWAQGAEQNRQAAVVDAAYRKLSPQQGIYHFYMAHDEHFLAWTCMMLGRREEGLAAARAMLRNVPAEFAEKAAPFVDPLASIEISVLMRFGQWEEILALPRPPAHFPVTIAMWHFARGSALAAQGKVEEAKAEQGKFHEFVAALPKETMLQQNPASKGMAIADQVLEGEIAFREGEIDRSVAALTEAVRTEDSLRYIEPPDWLQPARHSLGAVLMSAERFREAEAVYRADLEHWPENGWALYGLAQALKAQQSQEADAVETRFKKAWEHADTDLSSTCLCVSRGKEKAKTEEKSRGGTAK